MPARKIQQGKRFTGAPKIEVAKVKIIPLSETIISETYKIVDAIDDAEMKAKGLESIDCYFKTLEQAKQALSEMKSEKRKHNKAKIQVHTVTEYTA